MRTSTSIVLFIGATLIGAFADMAQESKPTKPTEQHSPPLLSVDNHWKVAEDAKIYSVIAQAQAINSDPGMYIFTFGLEADHQTNETLPFNINPFTGIVYLNDSLEGKGGKSFSLYVTVSDGRFTTKSGVLVNIKFKSDSTKQNVTLTYPVSVSPVNVDSPSNQSSPINLPPILQIDNQWNITEDAEVNSMLAHAQAIDPDPSDKLTFGLESGDEFDDKTLPFRINLYSGMVYLNESLKGRSGEKIFMYVTVNDGAHNAKDGVYVNIIPKDVLPVNDDEGAFNSSNRQQKSYETTTTNSSAKQNSPPVLLVDNLWNIPENAEVNSVISKIKAVDTDPEDKLTFGLESVDKYEEEALPFRIDPITAVVYLNESLIGRDGENLTLFVTVTDGTYNAKNIVNVKIIPETALNDNNNETYPYITLPKPPNQPIANNSNDQQQNSNQTAQTNASPEHNSPPVLLVDNEWNIPEDAEINSIVAKTQATDVDPGAMLAFGLEFVDKFEEETLPFRINPYTGIVFLDENLDGRAGEKLSLFVTVTDGTYNVKNGVHVKITPKIPSKTITNPVSSTPQTHTDSNSSNDRQHKTNETVKAGYGTFVVHTNSMKNETPKLQIVNYLYFYIFIGLLLFRNLHQLQTSF